MKKGILALIVLGFSYAHADEAKSKTIYCTAENAPITEGDVVNVKLKGTVEQKGEGYTFSNYRVYVELPNKREVYNDFDVASSLDSVKNDPTYNPTVYKDHVSFRPLFPGGKEEEVADSALIFPKSFDMESEQVVLMLTGFHHRGGSVKLNCR